MNPKFALTGLAAVTLLSLGTPHASAIPLNYDIGTGSTVSLNATDPGLVVNFSLVPNLASNAFTLNDGGITTFNFFKIWTDESTLNTSPPEDDVLKPITATLDFAVPTIGATVSGTTVGVVSGLFQSGAVTWSGPATIILADRTFTVSLSNETFNQGFFGLDEGVANGATVTATIKQLSSNNRVPDSGGTAILLGLAFVGMAIAGRKQIAA